LVQYDITDVKATQTASTDGTATRVMDEVNQSRQKPEVAHKQSGTSGQKQPAYLDFSTPIYPNDTSGGAGRAAESQQSAGAGKGFGSKHGGAADQAGGGKSSPDSKSDAGAKQATAPNPNDLKPPSTPGHESYDLNGNKTTKWDNGAVLSENEKKGTRDLRIPDKQGGYQEQHWGPNQADNYRMTHHADNINASNEFSHDVTKAYNEIPHGIRKAIDQKDFQIVTAKKVSDSEPGLKKNGTQPTGYAKGEDIDDAPSFYNQRSKLATIAEKPNSLPLGDTKGLVKHESGHGFDDSFKGAYSNSDEFKAAYNRDLAKLSPADRKELDYYIQPKDGNGRAETFAESFCQALGCKNDPDQMAKYFPESYALVQKKMREAEEQP